MTNRQRQERWRNANPDQWLEQQRRANRRRYHTTKAREVALVGMIETSAAIGGMEE